MKTSPNVGVDGYLLLRLRVSPPDNPVWFVVKHTNYFKHGIGVFEDATQSMTYFVNEHTCPTNLVPVECIIEGYDLDPHGVFEFVAWEPSSKVTGEEGDDSRWLRVFPQLREKPV